ncbi:MAG: hypothetical protein LBE83_09725, partial [Propionibacteriaceae bacterium]|nr:hypothetical protein [Propionibacteriaceae bacterium]
MDYFPPTFPGLSPARRGPQLTALVVVGMAILVALGVVAFPFVARGTALASLPPSGGNLVPSADPTPTPTVIGERADDLEVRTLPLLTTEARQAWQLDDLTAVEQAGQALFGAEWSQFRQASDWHAVGWGMSGGVYDLGEPGRLAKRALAGLSPLDEPRVLDLIGLLIAQTGPLSDGDMAAALALGESAASHFKSCDSLLTRAHLWSLVYRGVGMLVHEDLTTRWLGIEPFEAAVAACGSDPTAAIEQFKYLTGNRGCAAVGPAYHSWYAYEIVFR